MDAFEGMSSRQRTPGSTGDGDRIRVSSSADDGAGAGTSSASLEQARGDLLPKNVNFSLFLRPSVARWSAQGGCHREGSPGRGCGFIRRPVDLTNEAGRLRHPGEEVKNVSRDAEPSLNPGRDERVLGLSTILESTGGERCQGEACRVQVPAPSACSQGASNNPGVQPKRTYEDCQSSSRSNSDSEDSHSEDSERMERRSHERDPRSSVRNSPSARRRRGRVNKKLRALQELLPNCDAVDEAAVLDEAIMYLKALQQQFLPFQVMSMRSPMYMSPPVMLPARIQQMYTPYLNQFPQVNVLSGMNSRPGVGCGGIQFPISHGPRTTPASIGSGMLGLQHMAHTLPFIPSFGQSSMPASSTQGPSTDLMDSAARSGSGDMV